MTVELGRLLKEEKTELKELATALATGNREKIGAALAALVLALAVGHPEVSLLAPFMEEGLRLAFASTGTRRLQQALADADDEEARAKFAQQIAAPVEALIGQALVQLVRVQHRTTDEVLEALGGLRDDFAGFRAEFDEQLVRSQVRVETQHVSSGGTGLRISAGARTPIWIGEMTVTGAGAIGIDLRKR
jgi:hypothetical protein